MTSNTAKEEDLDQCDDGADSPLVEYVELRDRIVLEDFIDWKEVNRSSVRGTDGHTWICGLVLWDQDSPVDES